MEQLSKHEINYVGAGKYLVKVAKPVIIEKDGLKVGVYASEENEFSIVGNRAGANHFDPLESLYHIFILINNL